MYRNSSQPKHVTSFHDDDHEELHSVTWNFLLCLWGCSLHHIHKWTHLGIQICSWSQFRRCGGSYLAMSHKVSLNCRVTSFS